MALPFLRFSSFLLYNILVFEGFVIILFLYMYMCPCVCIYIWLWLMLFFSLLNVYILGNSVFCPLVFGSWSICCRVGVHMPVCTHAEAREEAWEGCLPLLLSACVHKQRPEKDVFLYCSSHVYACRGLSRISFSIAVCFSALRWGGLSPNWNFPFI